MFIHTARLSFHLFYPSRAPTKQDFTISSSGLRLLHLRDPRNNNSKLMMRNTIPTCKCKYVNTITSILCTFIPPVYMVNFTDPLCVKEAPLLLLFLFLNFQNISCCFIALSARWIRMKSVFFDA